MKNKTIVKFAVGGFIIISIIIFLAYQSFSHIKSKNINENQLSVFWNNEYIDIKNIEKIKDHFFMPIDELIKRGYDNFIKVSNSNRVYIDFKTPKFELEEKSLTEALKPGVKINILTNIINKKQYLDLNAYHNILGFKFQYNELTKVLYIVENNSENKVGILNRSTHIRPYADLFKKQYRKMKKGEAFRVLEIKKNWSKIITDDAFIGYIPTKSYELKLQKSKKLIKLNKIREVQSSENINLTWHQIGKAFVDLDKEETKPGLNVISPTWFSLVNDRGFILNNANKLYVEAAHRKGYKVWALIDNGFDADLTRQFLMNKEGRENFKRLLTTYVALYDLDGINIDFENIYYKDRDKFTEFVKDLTLTLKKQNIIVSIDITVPDGSPNWSLFYDRRKIGEVVDYCMLMAYDEHWASSPKSGSVASYPWVENGIIESLKEIPNEKLILGIPFYTRIWTETIRQNRKIKIRSKAISMLSAEKIVNEKNLQKIWLNKEKQYFVSYIENGNNKIWLEDENSIKLKIQLIDKYKLAGLAFWKKGLEKDIIWKLIKPESIF